MYLLVEKCTNDSVIEFSVVSILKPVAGRELKFSIIMFDMFNNIIINAVKFNFLDKNLNFYMYTNTHNNNIYIHI